MKCLIALFFLAGCCRCPKQAVILPYEFQPQAQVERQMERQRAEWQIEVDNAAIQKNVDQAYEDGYRAGRGR